MILNLPTPEDLDADEARDELKRMAHALAPEELQVLVLLGRRLYHGQFAYGELNVARDRRDFEKERGEELADALVYTAMAELKRLKRCEGGH